MYFTCGRRNSPFSVGHGKEGIDYWKDDSSCSYCGSLDPEVLLRRMKEKSVILGPTDKNYKMYLRPKEGTELFKQTYNDDGKLVTSEVKFAKFYFQHFTVAQQEEFIRLLNEKEQEFEYPGYFYTLPYFCKPIK